MSGRLFLGLCGLLGWWTLLSIVIACVFVLGPVLGTIGAVLWICLFKLLSEEADRRIAEGVSVRGDSHE